MVQIKTIKQQENLKNHQEIKFELVRMEPQNTNSILVSCGSDAVAFDTWGRADDWIELLDERSLNLIAIYSTHGHSDHISASPELVRKLGCKWFLNTRDKCLIGQLNSILEYFHLNGLGAMDDLSANLLIGDNTLFGILEMKVFELPGHTMGGVGYYFPENKILLLGDTLFKDGCGRVDFGGNINLLYKSISNIYSMNLSDDTICICGHGENTTIAKLKIENPYFKNYE